MVALFRLGGVDDELRLADHQGVREIKERVGLFGLFPARLRNSSTDFTWRSISLSPSRFASSRANAAPSTAV